MITSIRKAFKRQKYWYSGNEAKNYNLTKNKRNNNG